MASRPRLPARAQREARIVQSLGKWSVQTVKASLWNPSSHAPAHLCPVTAAPTEQAEVGLVSRAVHNGGWVGTGGREHPEWSGVGCIVVWNWLPRFEPAHLTLSSLICWLWASQQQRLVSILSILFFLPLV